ncbi:hypothetical protein [Enterococcus faecium]|uniref:hypothetical protein n=1 Tax=Enterococcus faecium TaxID=1352 RepID=UPI000CF2FFE5|nr:hypothetical protein [Enterococcus faecium]PQG47319.1 hypothetical protein CUS80_02750 [Enterococcus faecium]
MEVKVKYEIHLSFYKLTLLMEIIFVVILLGSILNTFNIYNLSFFNKYIEMIDLKDEQLARQIIFSQVSLSFLILSLLSFLTNLKKDKILGTSIYSIVFAFSIFGNLTLISLAVFGLLFANIIMYFSNPQSIFIPNAFLITMILLSIYILKIIFYTNNLKKSINKISTLYYIKNKQIIKHGMIKHHQNYETPQIILNLVDDTEKKILIKDINYNSNFQVYEQISKLSLINFRRTIQENYTEIFLRKNDIIAFWIRQITVLIECNLLNSAIEQYNNLLSILINNRVFLNSYELNHMLNKILKQIKFNSNTELVNQLQDQIFYSMKLSINYSYFKLNNDFSYTRLGKNNNILFHTVDSDFYRNYYLLVWDNKSLSEVEKRKLIYDMIQKIRISAIDFDSPLTFYSNINVKYYDILQAEEYGLDGDLELVGTPLGILLYEVISKKDYSSIYLLLYQYNQNSIYYASLLVISKLVSQYLNATGDKKYVQELIKILSKKLEKWDTYKLKFNKMKVIRNETIDRLYSNLFFNSNDIKSLNYVYQSIQMKKHKVSCESPKNDDLKKVYILINNDDNWKNINEKWSKHRDKITELLFPVV